ncbi:Protein 4.1, partial [Saguinus oedipus]
AAVDSADRSPRPTSAPAIAQSQVAEGGIPGTSAKKTGVPKAQKETVKAEVKKEEEPPEQAEPEPTEAWKIYSESTVVEKSHTEVTVPTSNGDQTQKD